MSTDIVHGAGRALNETIGRAYCGRKAKTTEAKWSRVTCPDCLAAHRADQEAS